MIISNGGYVNSLQKTGLTLMTDGMSRSRKKQIASKRFRRRVRILMRLRKYERLPYRSTELTSPWDLGGDGKCFYGYHPDKEWYAKVMRK